MDFVVIPLVFASTSLLAVALTGGILTGLMALMQRGVAPARTKK